MKNLSLLDWTMLIILAVGGLNWGTIALFDINLVSSVFGELTALTRIVYGLVGISAIYMIVSSAAGGMEESSYDTNRKIISRT